MPKLTSRLSQPVFSRLGQPGWLACCCMALCLPAFGSPESPEPLPIVHSMAEWWQIPDKKENATYPLESEVVVLCFDPSWRNLWVSDHGVGAYFDVGSKPLVLHTGQLLRIKGTVALGKNISTDDLTFERVQENALPTAVRANEVLPSQALPEAGWVEFEGYVDSQLEIDSTHQRLELIAAERVIETDIITLRGQEIPRLAGSFVRFRGLSMTRRNPDTNALQIYLRVPGLEYIETLTALTSDPRLAQVPTPVISLDQARNGSWVHLSGQVVKQEPGRSVTLADSSGEITIPSPQRRALALNEKIDVIAKVLRSADATALSATVVLPSESTAPEPTRLRRRIRLAEQVTSLAPSEANENRPVRLTGLVTWANPAAKFFYLLDGTRGVCVQLRKTMEPPPVGTILTVAGTTVAGDYAPEVMADDLQPTVTNQDIKLPPAHPITVEQALSGVENALWVEIIGYLKRHEQQGPWSYLTLTTSGGEFQAVVPADVNLSLLENSVLRLHGVCRLLANERHQLTGFQLWVPSTNNIRVEEAPSPSPFLIPLRTVHSLRQFNPLQNNGHRIRVQATVTHHKVGSVIYAQEDNENFQILSSGTEVLVPGDRIEAVGFPHREGSLFVLRESVYRRIGSAASPAPLTLRSESLLDGSYNGSLVSIEASLLEVLAAENSIRLLLQSQHTVFDATLRGPAAPKNLAPGSLVRVTGMYQLIRDANHRPQSLQLELRSPQDLSVLVPAPWWNPQRAVASVGILALSLAGGLFWVRSLRQRVHAQTQQIRAQLSKVASLEARHRGIIENASDFIFTADRSGQITSFNPAGEAMTGYHRDQALKLNVRDLLAPESLAAGAPLLDLSIAPDGFATFQCQFRRRDGSLLWVETSARLLKDESANVSILAVVRDFSERKKYEEALTRARDAAEANARAKSTFLANMSHEIRTPMNGVIGMSNLLLDTDLAPEQRDFAETIRNSAEALLTVLNDILDFSKIEAGKLQFEHLDFELNECIESTLELLSSRAAAKGIELAVFTPAEVPPIVRGDPSRLRQVLINLVGNAIKFTESGEVLVYVHLLKETERDAQLRFEVKDTGVGLSEEAQSRLFQPFTQADSSTTRKFGGTGLGLAICKQIVELMGGEIGVSSKLGAGSTFWFTVNFPKSTSIGTEVVNKNSPGENVFSGLRVAVVDDNATNRCLLQYYLAAWGARCDSFASGTEALEGMRKAAESGLPFSLALLDFVMPEISGLVVAERIQNDPALRGMRCLLLSSLDHHFEREQLQACGISQMMTKPIRKAELRNAILDALPDQAPSVLLEGTRAPLPIMNQPGPACLRVLIAEDNVVNQRVARLQLEKLGHRVNIASNGLQALEAMERNRYDLILMDCQMPELDGYETTRRIRIGQSQPGVPIIAMTAHAMEGDREACLQAGMDDYISKPMRIQELTIVLERLYPAITRRRELSGTAAPFAP